MGQKWFEEKNECKKFLDHFSPMSGTLFFFQKLKKKFSIPLPGIFQHQGSGNSLRGVKAACIGPALYKFRPSVGDGATYPSPSINDSKFRGLLWIQSFGAKHFDLLKITTGCFFFFKLEPPVFFSLSRLSPVCRECPPAPSYQAHTEVGGDRNWAAV